jgi:UDP-glucose 4-epimerase
MRILVTGGAGFIGGITARMLLDGGHDVVVFDNLERGHREALDPRARLVVGDLRERENILRAVREAQPDAIVHFAAYALVGESMADPLRYYRNNVIGGLNLVEAMLETGVRRIVFSSSCATYGQPERLPIVEETPQNPTNPYGHSKLVLEQILKWHAARKGFAPCFLRYFNACGAVGDLGEDHEPETHLIPNLLRVALGQRAQADLYGDDYPTPDGTCIRDYVHVHDLADAHIRALMTGATGAFNLGTGAGASVREVLTVCRRITGHPIPECSLPRRPGDPPTLVASGEKARQVLGWAPVHSTLDRIVSDAWTWHQRHPQGYGGKVVEGGRWKGRAVSGR